MCTVLKFSFQGGDRSTHWFVISAAVLKSEVPSKRRITKIWVPSIIASVLRRRRWSNKCSYDSHLTLQFLFFFFFPAESWGVKCESSLREERGEGHRTVEVISLFKAERNYYLSGLKDVVARHRVLSRFPIFYERTLWVCCPVHKFMFLMRVWWLVVRIQVTSSHGCIFICLFVLSCCLTSPSAVLNLILLIVYAVYIQYQSPFSVWSCICIIF